MRRFRTGIVIAGLLAITGCGGGTTYANRPRPPAPINLSVYINNARVSVSPSTVGAGPVSFVVTNSATSTESLSIQTPDGGQTLGSTGPINPQATAELTVNFTPGDYTVGAGSQGNAEATQSTPSSIQPATIHIGPQRTSGSSELLQP
jgi:hypothetical protein